MKIDDIDLLKQWLVNVLNPIFDGDPEKLALYIVALAKKVDDDQPSRERCINDLEVFLETNTNTFVDSLFETLLSKKYLTTAGSSEKAAENPGTSSIVADSAVGSSNEASANLVKLNPTGGFNNGKNNEIDNRHSTHNDPRDQRSRRFNNPNNYNDDTTRRPDSYNNRQSSGGGGGFNKSRLSRDYQEIDSNLKKSTRSRSRSGRERHKNRTRNRTQRGVDSTSSSSSSSPETSRRYYRRSRSRSFSRSRSNSPRTGDSNVNNKKRCKDFDEKGICTLAEYCPYDHGEVVIAPIMNTQKQQQQQGAGVQNDMKPNMMNRPNQNYSVPPPNLMQGQYNSSNQGDMYQMQRSHHGRGMHHMKGMRRNQNNNMNNQGMFHQQQLPSGMPPIHNNLGQPRFPNQQSGNHPDFNPQQDFQQRQIMSTNRPRNLVNIVTSVPDQRLDNQLDFQANQQRGMKRSYNNMNVPINENNFQYNNMPPAKEFNPNQQALLPNPPGMPNISQPGFNQPPTGNFPPNQQNQMPNIPRPSGPSQPSSNATLVLRKVPNELNRPDVIKQHFLKFGQILDVQSNYDNLNDAALIKFANNQSAFAAFKSPESILNNRFIRIHWLNHYQKHQHQQQQQQIPNQQNFQQQRHSQYPHQLTEDEPTLKRHVKDRLAFDNQSNAFNQQELIKNKENKLLDKQTADLTNSMTPAGSSNTKSTEDDVDPNSSSTRDETSKQDGSGQVLSNNFNSMTIKQAEKNKYQENLAAKAISDENQKKVLLLKMQVKQKARELIEQQIKDQKLLLKKFEQAKTVEEKSQILSLVKKLNESIEKEKDILNNKSYSFDEQHGISENPYSTSPFSFQKTFMPGQIAQKSIPPPAHSLRLNNLRQNQPGFLKNQSLAANSALQKSKESPTHACGSPTKATPATTADNKPKQLIISGVENVQGKEAILSFVNAIGCQLEGSSEVEKNETTNLYSFVISFSTRKDAEMALAKCSSSLTSKTISITWFRPDSQTKPTSDTELPKTNSPSVAEDTDSPPQETNTESTTDEKPKPESPESSTDPLVQEATPDEPTSRKDIMDSLFDESVIDEAALC